ncbi:MAG: hypothetical protein H0T60_18670 [Acidobacteria bacterium]|nr:hypothetical protein [Acidobacteriota bacterium]
MSVESTNPVSSDTGSVSDSPPTDLDNLPDLADDEPDTDPANESGETQGADGESETGATEDGQEPEQSEPAEGETKDETETEGTPAKAGPEVKDDVVVTLQTGDKVALSDLKSGYMRQQDYSRKTQELSNKRRDLETTISLVNQSVDGIAEMLKETIPPAPDISLSWSDPGRYVSEKAMHEAATARLHEVINRAQAPREVAQQLNQEQRTELIHSENARLAEVMPQTATQQGRQKFFAEASAVAKEIGFSDVELQGAVDHRMFVALHYARKGMEAERAQKTAKAKVANVPPVSPQKRPQAGKGASANAEAMKRLAQTGSIKDALSVDFD